MRKSDWEEEELREYLIRGRMSGKIRSTSNAFGYAITVSSIGNNKNVYIPHLNPHYTDRRFDHAQLIWGRDDAKDIGWEYSDRLWQWDYEKSKLSFEKAKALHDPGTANYYEAYLSFYFDKPIELVGIMSGVNMSNGYSYLVYGYREKNNEHR